MVRRAALSTLVLTLACGGSSAAPGAAPAAETPTFTFTASGLTPSTLSVKDGGCILVKYGDPATAHAVEPDDLSVCPELIGGITLPPGDSWDWCGFKKGPKTCRFHDPTGSPAAAFAAVIQVGAP